MRGNDVTVLWIGVGQYVLNEVIAVLVACNFCLSVTDFVETNENERTINERNAWTVGTSFTNSGEVAFEKVRTSDLEAFLDDLGSKLIHAVLGSVTKDVINSVTTVRWQPMLADMLNAPVAKLSVSNNIDACEDLVDARTLPDLVSVWKQKARP
jgi:hypothetical protein